MCVTISSCKHVDLGNKIVYKIFRTRRAPLTYGAIRPVLNHDEFQGMFNEGIFKIGETHRSRRLPPSHHRFKMQYHYEPGFHGFQKLEEAKAVALNYSDNGGCVIVKCKLFNVYVSGFDIINGFSTFVGDKVKLLKIVSHPKRGEKTCV